MFLQVLVRVPEWHTFAVRVHAYHINSIRIRGYKNNKTLVDGGGGELVFFDSAIEGIATDSQSASGHFFVPIAIVKNFSEQLDLICPDHVVNFLLG